MYLRQLHIRNLKLLKDFHLSFANERGEPRMWTVIIGENGTGKTSILQAIAMAAAGALNVNSLIDNVSSLRDKRAPRSDVIVEAEFALDARYRHLRSYPGFPGGKPQGEVRIDSSVVLSAGKKNLVARSFYESVEGGHLQGLKDVHGREVDPLDEARSTDAQLWFVAAYGIQRFLPRNINQKQQELNRPSVDRLRPVFQPVPLIGTGFANLLAGRKATAYSNVLRKALFSVEGLLPNFDGLEMRGRGGVRSAQDLQERHRFVQVLPSGRLKLAANWLSHGYQSTIAWIADLVGQILWEAKSTLDPEDMEGLVLIDELDLYLHPRWQRTLIQTLKQTFPRLQFVVTTHSPLALVGLRPDQDEIVRLHINERTGDITSLDMKRGRAHEPDPRLMTGSELYQSYFGIERFYPDRLGDLLREHRYLAADPGRDRRAEERLDAIEAELRREGVEPDFPREPRSRR